MVVYPFVVVCLFAVVCLVKAVCLYLFARCTPQLASAPTYTRSILTITIQWGLTEYDLKFVPPSYKFSFATDRDPEQSFGSEMGVYNGTDWGRKLVPKEYNALVSGRCCV